MSNHAIKVYSNRDKFLNLSHNLPNQIRTNKQLRLYSTLTNGKEINRARFYSSSSLAPLRSSAKFSFVNPWFISGLTDAEGSFVCIVRKSEGHRLGWRVEVIFQIGLHKKDLELLKLIQAYFDGIGTIDTSSSSKTNMCAFRVSSLKQILNKIIPLRLAPW